MGSGTLSKGWPVVGMSALVDARTVIAFGKNASDMEDLRMGERSYSRGAGACKLGRLGWSL